MVVSLSDINLTERNKKILNKELKYTNKINLMNQKDMKKNSR